MTDFPGLVDALAAPGLAQEERERCEAALERAAGADRAGFIRFVRSISLDEDNFLFEIYEALATNPETWGPFILEEMDRVFFHARTAADPARVLAPLEALAFFRRTGGSWPSRILARLAAEFASPFVPVRRRAAWLAGDYLTGNEGDAIERLRRLLVGDPDWRVRYFAEDALKQCGKLPAGYGRPLLDRLRAKFLDPFGGRAPKTAGRP